MADLLRFLAATVAAIGDASQAARTTAMRVPLGCSRHVEN
jgi:hypothetical protein